MSRADYAHWNEDADYMWWHEEGKHIEEPPEPDDDWRGWDEEEHDHQGTAQCLQDGCFSTRDGVHWSCDICGDDGFTQDADRMIVVAPTRS